MSKGEPDQELKKVCMVQCYSYQCVILIWSKLGLRLVYSSLGPMSVESCIVPHCFRLNHLDRLILTLKQNCLVAATMDRVSLIWIDQIKGLVSQTSRPVVYHPITCRPVLGLRRCQCRLHEMYITSRCGQQDQRLGSCKTRRLVPLSENGVKRAIRLVFWLLVRRLGKLFSVKCNSVCLRGLV